MVNVSALFTAEANLTKRIKANLTKESNNLTRET